MEVLYVGAWLQPNRLEWGEQDSNLRRQCQCIYSASPLAARTSPRGSRETIVEPDSSSHWLGSGRPQEKIAGVWRFAPLAGFEAIGGGALRRGTATWFVRRP